MSPAGDIQYSQDPGFLRRSSSTTKGRLFEFPSPGGFPVPCSSGMVQGLYRIKGLILALGIPKRHNLPPFRHRGPRKNPLSLQRRKEKRSKREGKRNSSNLSKDLHLRDYPGLGIGLREKRCRPGFESFTSHGHAQKPPHHVGGRQKPRLMSCKLYLTSVLLHVVRPLAGLFGEA
jgi:hypothetical protein